MEQLNLFGGLPAKVGPSATEMEAARTRQMARERVFYWLGRWRSGSSGERQSRMVGLRDRLGQLQQVRGGVSEYGAPPRVPDRFEVEDWRLELEALQRLEVGTS